MAKKLPGLDPDTFHHAILPTLQRYQKKRRISGMTTDVERGEGELRLVFRATEFMRKIVIPLPYETIRTYVRTQKEAAKFISRTLDLVDRRLGY